MNKNTSGERVALYRKYRPQDFDEVRGQDHVVSVLEGAIADGNFSHAYLFAGSRGTGKTSVARILAREIGARERDVYEIDAASNRGIDDIRELRENVEALPFESPYKVYIVDECLTGDHLISMADGTVKPIRDVKDGDAVLTTDLKTGKLVTGEISNFFSRPTEQLIKIRTPFTTISCTPSHRLWVIRGGHLKKVQAREVALSDFLFSPRKMPHVPSNSATPEQLSFLALIQCDGHISKDSNTIQVEVGKDVDYFVGTFKRGIKAWNCSGRLSIKRTARGTTLIRFYSKDLKKVLTELLCHEGKKSTNVDIPDFVFQAPLESIRSYLDTCFCCEGDATHTPSTRLYKLSLSMCSNNFTKKLQLLLKKFEINASRMTIKRKKSHHNTVYRLNITGYDLRLFQEKIGLSIERKSKILKGQLLTKEKQDSIPIQQTLLDERARLSLTHSILNGSGIYLAKDQGLTRTAVEQFIEIAQLPKLNTFLEFNYHKILSIKEVRKKEKVYDFTVEGTHTFFANGICTSNCHMLTKEAFNALLKTLEEPPSHAVFVLATTEMHKLPDTVISRCEVHQFKKPNLQLLEEMIEEVAKGEGYALEPGASELIALLGEGSFRDAQGTLQKVINAAGRKKTLSVDLVEEVTGAPRGETINDIIRAIEGGDTGKALSKLEGASEGNTDMKTLLTLLVQRIRYILLLRHAPDMEEQIKEDLAEDDFNFLQERAKDNESNIRSYVLYRLLGVFQELGYAAVPQLPLELALIDIIADNGGR